MTELEPRSRRRRSQRCWKGEGVGRTQHAPRSRPSMYILVHLFMTLYRVLMS
jgi:hypothetical protein